jgi:hypothetical protein
MNHLQLCLSDHKAFSGMCERRKLPTPIARYRNRAQRGAEARKRLSGQILVMHSPNQVPLICLRPETVTTIVTSHFLCFPSTMPMCLQKPSCPRRNGSRIRLRCDGGGLENGLFVNRLTYTKIRWAVAEHTSELDALPSDRRG